MSIFSGIQKFMSGIFKPKMDKKVLSGIDIDIDRIYEDPSIAKELQELYQKNMDEVDEINKYLPKLKDEYESVQKIERLSPNAKEQLASLARIYSETTLKRTDFKNKHTIDDSKDPLEDYQDVMDEALQVMKETEEHQQLVKMDLAYLEAEKEELLYQKDRLLSASRLLNSVFIFVSIMALIVVLVLTVMISRFHVDVIFAAIIAMILVIVTTIWVYFTRRVISRELVKNTKLLQKAITLTNKTKIKYINDKNLLDYQYKKYKVDSYYMFAMRIENYRQNKQNKTRYENINNSLSATVTDIESFLRNVDIPDDNFVFDNMDYLISKDGRKKLDEKYTEAIGELEDRYKKLEKENAVIYIVLANYKSSQGGR